MREPLLRRTRPTGLPRIGRPHVRPDADARVFSVPAPERRADKQEAGSLYDMRAASSRAFHASISPRYRVAIVSTASSSVASPFR